jgi:polar amino acid transport system ATP-binding protein
MENYEYILETEHVSKNFGNLVVLKDINLKVKKGEVICIIGPSGAGKSTYLRSLNQLEKISSGKIFIKGDLFLHREKDRTVERIDKKTQQQLLLEMGMCFQRFNLFPHKTVLENICLAPVQVKHEDKETVKKEAMELLKIFHMEHLADTVAGSLPYGAQRRLETLRALATNPSLLLLDEPAAGMNPHETAELMDTIVYIRDRFQIAVLLIEHDMSLVMGICEGICVLNFGKVIAKGTAEEIQNNETVIEAYLGKRKEAHP